MLRNFLLSLFWRSSRPITLLTGQSPPPTEAGSGGVYLSYLSLSPGGLF